MHRTAALRWLAPLVLTMACDAEPEDPTLSTRVAVGTVEGTDIVLGALIDGDELAIYQCGGDTTFASHTGWFRGRFGAGDDTDAFELVLDDLRLEGLRDADGLEGELVEADGTRHDFRLDPVADDAEAGVYTVAEGDVSVGVVVRTDGDAVVAQGAACEGRLPCTQVIILAPVTIADERIDVSFTTSSGLSEAQVTRTFTAP
ncbi:MAG: hypothetical protein AB1Z98_08925 [Nannocystaceae bacterium]